MNDNLPIDVDVWLAEHPDESRDELEKVWRLSEVADEPFEPDQQRVAEMRRQLSTRMADKPGSMRLLRSRSTWAVAASVALIMATGALLWTRPVTVTAPRGATAMVTLPDESTVILNSGSTLTHRRTFGWTSRTVTLAGEARFDVTKGDSEFEVSTFNGRITVLGTRFNVRAHGNDLQPETKVSVEEGVVRVARLDAPGGGVLLEIGEWSTISGGLPPTEPESISSHAQPVWQSGGMVFTNMLLSDILREVERRFGVEISAPPDSLGNARASLYIRSALDPGTVLEMLAVAHNLKVTETVGGFELSAK